MSSISKGLYAIVNVDSQHDPIAYSEKLLAAGVKTLQLRSKSAQVQELSSIARAVIRNRTAQGSQCKIIINDFPEVALKVGADGVHLGQGDASVYSARELLGNDAIIGLSSHTLTQVERGKELQIDYLGFGPVYESSTKSGHAEVVGTSTLATAVQIAFPIPVVAIGGITLQRMQEVVNSGAHCVAVISDLEQANDCEQYVRSVEKQFS